MNPKPIDNRSLVERLRSRGWEDRQHRWLREEAAKEIERLSAEVMRLKGLINAEFGDRS